MDGTAMITWNAGWKWTDVIHDMGMRLSDIAHPDLVIKGERLSDLGRAKREGKIALIAWLESSTPLKTRSIVSTCCMAWAFGVSVSPIPKRTCLAVDSAKQAMVASHSSVANASDA